MAEWLKHHVSGLAAPERYATSVKHWIKFFELARRCRWIEHGPVVSDLTPHLQARFREWREKAGVGGHTLSRDIAALRGALSWAWKSQLIDHPPFIADVPTHKKAPPRDRVLSIEEVAALFEACRGRPEREHIIRFLVLELGTAGRPQAVLELTDANIDLRRNLIDPNQKGQRHLRKRRAIVPMANALRPWVTGITGKIIRYSVPLKDAKSGERRTDRYERPTHWIRKSWSAVCRDAKVVGATPKTLRHTMLTWLAERGVPYEQRQRFAGHASQGTTARNYEHLSPDYLKTAVGEVDAYFERIEAVTGPLQSLLARAAVPSVS